MEIRTASLQDLEDIAAVEAACFPVEIISGSCLKAKS